MGVQISKAQPISRLELLSRKQPEAKVAIEWVRAKDVAKQLGVSLPTVSKLTNRKVDPIPHRRLSGILQYDLEKVKEWEERNTTEG